MLPAASAAALPQWPQANSDLAADPDVTFGVLPNGLRYAVRHNVTPPGQVSMRFAILAGSLEEAHDQEGLAHVLEHMAFRGSAHVPDGEMISTLQRLGLRLGADLNASTSRTMTTYQFDLAKGDAQSVDTGLMLFREIASDLTLDPKLLDAERKIVTAEAHTRTPAELQYEAVSSNAVFGDHPYARLPIGRIEVIQNAPVQRLRDFYEAYYRPENAMLVIVGDIDPADIVAKLAAKFSDWKGRGKAGPEPGPIAVKTPQPLKVVLADIPGLTPAAQGLQLYYRHAWRPFRADAANTEESEIAVLAGMALNVRLAQMLEVSGRPAVALSALSLSDEPPLLRMDRSSAGFVSNWQDALALLVKARRQFLQTGLSADELKLVVAQRRSLYQQLVAISSAQQSPALASGILYNGATGNVSRNAKQLLEFFDRVVAKLTPERVIGVARKLAAKDEPIIVFAPPQPIAGGEQALRDVYTKAEAAPVVAYQPPAAKAWHYTDFGTPGTVAEKRDVAAGVTMIRFANGVRLTVKPTDFAKGQILVSVQFGHGQLDLPRDKVTAADFGVSAMNFGGLDDMTMTELGQALAGRGVDAFAQQGGTAFTLGRTMGPVTPDALELQMQLFAARIAHPGWRTEFWPGLIASLANSDDADLSSPMNVWGREGPALLHPDDARWVANTGALRASWTPDQAVAFMKPIVETAPIEIVMVGDITIDRAIEVTAKTFGALPSRTETKEPAGLREAHFPKPVTAPVVLHHNGPDSQALAVIAWPTTDGFADRMDTHAAAVLSSVIQERAIARLRNAEGKTYTPIVGTDFSQVFPGYGVLMAMAQVEAVDVDEVFATFDDIAADILAHGISDDEFQRALKPRIEGSERNQTNNLFWLRALVGAQADPRKLDFAATQAEEFHKVTLADVMTSAKKWLDRKRSWRAEVIPQAKAASSGQ